METRWRDNDILEVLIDGRVVLELNVFKGGKDLGKLRVFAHEEVVFKNRWLDPELIEVVVNGETFQLQIVDDGGHLIQTGFIKIRGVTLSGGMAFGESREASVQLLEEIFSEAVNSRVSVVKELASVVVV